jgi:GNAT superfamily N-acetyltransferase
MKITISPASKSKAALWVSSLAPNPAIGILLAGDRWFCVSHVLTATVNGKIVGVSTVADKGEMGEGVPTIVALYVLPKYRNNGIGTKLFEATVDYMLSLGLSPIRVDILNPKISIMVKKLPKEKRVRLVVNNLSSTAVDMIEIMEQVANRKT